MQPFSHPSESLGEILEKYALIWIQFRSFQETGEVYKVYKEGKIIKNIYVYKTCFVWLGLAQLGSKVNHPKLRLSSSYSCSGA